MADSLLLSLCSHVLNVAASTCTPDLGSPQHWLTCDVLCSFLIYYVYCLLSISLLWIVVFTGTGNWPVLFIDVSQQLTGWQVVGTQKVTAVK